MNPRSRRLGLVGAALLAGLALTALAAPILTPYDPNARSGRPFARPSLAHPLGTNDVGHDLASELLHGGRVTLLVGLAAAASAVLLGAAVGVAAGYARGGLDTALMRVVDVVLALPVLPLTIVIGVYAGPGLSTQVVVIAAVLWAGVARELRAQVLSLRERDHVRAVRAMGAGPWHVARWHLLPAVAPLAVPQFVLATKTAVLLEASLAFLGLGDLAAKSWGTMLSTAHARSAFLTDAWLWWVLPPGIAIALTVLAFALLGTAFEERARPALRTGPTGAAPAGPEWAAVPVRADRPALDIENLHVRYRTDTGAVEAVAGVSLQVAAGELVALVGESGSGKSSVAAAALGLLPPAAAVTGGRVLVAGHDLAALPPARLRRLRGRVITLVPQEAMSALNPVHTVLDQLVEAIRAHRRVDRAGAAEQARELLRQVGIDPARGRDHPHQFSGGMRQRVMIAMALANEPKVLIADEPTTGLDVLVQAEVLDLLDGLRRRLDLAVLVVSHDLPVVERIADRIAVMRAGRVVEVGPAAQLLTAPRHPYTATLVAATVLGVAEPTAEPAR